MQSYLIKEVLLSINILINKLSALDEQKEGRILQQINVEIILFLFGLMLYF